MRPDSAQQSYHHERRPRVLMVVESAAGGTGRHVLDLTEGLTVRGCEVHLIHSSRRVDKPFLDRLATMKNVPRLAIAMRTGLHPADAWAVRTIRAYARQYGPFDVIHGHSSKGGAAARLAALGTGAAAFYTLHGLIMMDPGLARWKRAFYLAIERGLALRTALIIAVSPEEARSAARLGLGAKRVVLIPNGVGPAELAPRDAARQTIGAGANEIVVGFVGRLVSQKAVDVLISAFALAAQQVPKARLAIVGDGPLRAQLCTQAEQLGVGDRIAWLGERDARTVLGGFDVFAISSRKEGLPYVVLEAMAAGLPVVATESAGVEILVCSGENGCVVPRDDSRAFAEALGELLSDADLRSRYGAASLARASTFTIDAMVDRTLEAYQGVLRTDGRTVSAWDEQDADDLLSTPA